MAAMKTFEEVPIFRSVVCANRIIFMLSAVVLSWNALMSAPAEKNFSRSLFMTTTLISSLEIIVSTAASRSFMNARS